MFESFAFASSVGDKPVFNCELCPTTCGRRTDLRIHMQKLHTADKPLRCKRCNAEFPDRYTYKMHAKTHEGEKCYTCELCPYASISARHLESHMLIHTDQKPFECEHCDQSFRQKQLLRRHVNLYHNPDYVAPTPLEKRHQCPTCKKLFRHKGNLIRHMATHDPDSTIRKQARDLKMGRQKRIEIIDGKQVEIFEEHYEEYELVAGDEGDILDGDEEVYEGEEDDEGVPEDEEEEEEGEENADVGLELEDTEFVLGTEGGGLIGASEEEGEMQMLEQDGDGETDVLELVEEEDENAGEQVCYVDVSERGQIEGEDGILMNMEDGDGHEYVILKMEDADAEPSTSLATKSVMGLGFNADEDQYMLPQRE